MNTFPFSVPMLAAILLGSTTPRAEKDSVQDPIERRAKAKRLRAALAGRVKLGRPGQLSKRFGYQGMLLEASDTLGSEWYWNKGGSDSWDNSDGLAFPINPMKRQNTLYIRVAAIGSEATLRVGAFFFAGTERSVGKCDFIGEITAPGTYGYDISLACSMAGVPGVTGWKAAFWFSHKGASPQAVTISSISVTQRLNASSPCCNRIGEITAQ